MNKLKENYKKVLAYIISKRTLSYSIITIIILLSFGAILYKKYDDYLNNKVREEKVLSSKEDNDKKTTGTIKTDVENNISRHTLSDGFSSLSDEEIDSSTNNRPTNVVANTSSNKAENIDKSNITGMDLEILEGSNFNPRKNLNLKAMDIDGSNISDNIIIEKNTVNTTIPGTYSVVASVHLSNGKTKKREFNITVKEVRLDVSLEKFKAAKYNIKKGENIGFEIDLKVSKKHITPVSAMINGKEYSIYRGDENLFDILTNKQNYKVFVKAEDKYGIYEYNLEYIKMSNGAWISVGENTQTIEVLKDEATIKNFAYEEMSEDKKILAKFDIDDLDNSALNLKLEFYKDNILIDSINLDKLSTYEVDLPTSSNGIYELKILSDINLSTKTDESNIILNKEIFSTNINISNIDQTSITGNNIEIYQNDSFDFMNDLGLNATDFDGEDITDKIVLENYNIDTSKIGNQTITASVTNKYGKKYTKEFIVTVLPKNEEESSQFNLFSRMSKGYSRTSNRNKTTINSKNKKDDITAVGQNNTTIIGQNNTTIIGNNKEVNTTINVNGEVYTSDNVSGKIQVEIPTALSFTITSKGNLKTADYQITNKSSIPISVSVAQFIDTTVNRGIKIHPMEENISTLDRSNLHLELVGDNGRTVDLGKYINKDIEILSLDASQTKNVTLRGESGKAPSKDIDDNGLSDKFILRFKIKKV